MPLFYGLFYWAKRYGRIEVLDLSGNRINGIQINSNTWRFCGCWGFRRRALLPAFETETSVVVLALVAAAVAVVDVEATVVVETAALAVLEAIVSTVAVATTEASAVKIALSCTIYQYGAASLYSLGSMVKKSSSFHCSVSKVGRRIGSLFQHSSIISYRATLQLGGCGIR